MDTILCEHPSRLEVMGRTRISGAEWQSGMPCCIRYVPLGGCPLNSFCPVIRAFYLMRILGDWVKLSDISSMLMLGDLPAQVGSSVRGLRGSRLGDHGQVLGRNLKNLWQSGEADVEPPWQNEPISLLLQEAHLICVNFFFLCDRYTLRGAWTHEHEIKSCACSSDWVSQLPPWRSECLLQSHGLFNKSPLTQQLLDVLVVSFLSTRWLGIVYLCIRICTTSRKSH